MKSKLLAALISACLLLLVFTGCGMKMPDDTGESPSGSSGSPSGGSVSAATTITGVVSFIDNETIRLELVGEKDAQSSEDAPTVTIGSSVYVMSGITQSVAPNAETAVVFVNQGFASGRLGDIVAGDFLAVVVKGDAVLTVINAGHADVSEPSTGGEQPSVEPTGSSEPSPSIPDTTEPAMYTVTTDGLKVRSGPGIEYSKLGTLDKGSRITGIITNGWIEFTYDGKEAYSSAEYIELSTGPEGVPDSGESKTYTTTDNVLARSGPGTSSTSLGTLQKGTEVTGTVLGGWLKFTYNDQTAYCSAAYLAAG